MGFVPAAKQSSFPFAAGFFARFAVTCQPMSKPSSSHHKGMRAERSAGVVVFREDAAGRLFLLLDYGSHWDYPKGHVEDGETDRDAALRELAEETGIRDVQLVEDFKKEIVYFFRSPKGRLVRKTVVFFLASTTVREVLLSHEHVGYAWLTAEEAGQRLTYPTARDVFHAALSFLKAS